MIRDVGRAVAGVLERGESPQREDVLQQPQDTIDAVGGRLECTLLQVKPTHTPRCRQNCGVYPQYLVHNYITVLCTINSGNPRLRSFSLAHTLHPYSSEQRHSPKNQEHHLKNTPLPLLIVGVFCYLKWCSLRLPGGLRPPLIHPPRNRST